MKMKKTKRRRKLRKQRENRMKLKKRKERSWRRIKKDNIKMGGCAVGAKIIGTKRGFGESEFKYRPNMLRPFSHKCL